MKKTTIIISTILTFFIAAKSCGKVNAQVAGLSITPPTVEILLSPTKKVVQSFTIQNQGESGQFIANIYAIKPTGNDGQVEIDLKPLDPSTIPLVITSANNLKLGETFDLNKGASAQVTLSFEGASTDTTLDTYLALVVQAVATNNQTTTIPGISSLILTTLTPNNVLPIDLNIENFDLPLVHDNASPLFLSPTLKNNTETMIRPLGKLEVISPRVHNSETLTLYPNLILGSSSRRLAMTCSDQDNKNSTPCPLIYSPHWYNIGPYRLRLTITTQGGTKLTEVEKIIWILPIKASFTIIGGLTLIIALFLYTRSQRNKK